MPTKIVIVGGSFGGINAAYALRRQLRDRAEITVISKDAEFTFLPGALGWRSSQRAAGSRYARSGARWRSLPRIAIDKNAATSAYYQ